MGGRTNDFDDWVNGRSQADFEANAKYTQQNLETMRKSGYKKGVLGTGAYGTYGADPSKRGQEVDIETIYPRQAGETDEAYHARLESLAQGDYNFFGGKGLDGVKYTPPDAQPLTGAPPAAPDLTDESIKKARTAAFLRLQTGKNQSNSFATKGTLGGFDVGKPVLGGY